MAEGSRRASVREIVRNALISSLIGVALFFLMFIGRQDFWGWRLAVYGAFAGLVTYAFSHALDVAVGDRVRRRQLIPDKLVGVPLYFIAGICAFLAVTAVMRAARIMPFHMSMDDLWLALVFSGAISIVMGLLFYSFYVMRERLRESIARIKEQEFAEKELELARSIQKRLLPPEFLSGDGYAVHARNLAAHIVAGDFYDVFRLSDDALGLVVADVSGKGMGASLIMASVKAVLPFIAEGRSAAATLTELNRKLHAELGAREFVALAYVRFEPLTGVLELANAGLPDPYLLRNGVEAISVRGERFPLAARANTSYQSCTIALHAGERLLLLTDGLPEAPVEPGEPLGYEPLAQLIATASEREPRELIDHLIAGVRGATMPGLEDDWTVLVLEALPR